MLTEEVKKYIDKSILCWLATANECNEPNVSPKEMFMVYDDHTVQNIRVNQLICISFVDIFVQKRFKLKGLAKIIECIDNSYDEKKKLLMDTFTDRFPFKSIIEIRITKVDRYGTQLSVLP